VIQGTAALLAPDIDGRDTLKSPLEARSPTSPGRRFDQVENPPWRRQARFRIERGHGSEAKNCWKALWLDGAAELLCLLALGETSV